LAKVVRMRFSIFLRSIALLGLIALVALVPAWKRPGIPKPAPRAFGVTVGYGLGGARELDQLNSVWYTDYGFRGATFGAHQRLYLVEANSDWQSAPDIARQHRGEWWQFGNEPNDPNQDDLSPAEYAARYHAFYYALKVADPTASIVPAGIANADWRWADGFREAYRARFGRYPRVDGWSIHNYLLDSCADALDANVFESRVVAFRDWMTRAGESDKPLFLTEYGILYGNGCCGCPIIADEDVTKFMRTTTTWLIQSRLVQGWAWFTLYSGGRYNGDLFAGSATLTQVGATYRELIQANEKK
jgi:hypothetical protein